MQPSTFTISMEDGAAIIVRHYARPDATRLYISHGNGFAIDGYRVFWEPLLPDFDVVLFDMRNHGRNPSTGADGHNYLQMSRDLTTVHDAVEAHIGQQTRTIGVFHSMSSRAAMKNAVEIGSPFDGLVLFDPPSVPPIGHALYEPMRAFELKLTAWAAERPHEFASVGDLETAYAEARASAKWQPQARADMARAVLLPKSEGGFRLNCARELEASIYLAALTLDLWPMAASMGVPTKLIGADPQGRGGPPTGPANYALAHEGAYDYYGMDGVGHLLQIEKPEECRDVLRAFLTQFG